MHVFPELAPQVVAIDVPPDAAPTETLATATRALDQLGTPQTLLLTDVFGATPCNVAQRLVDGVHVRLVAGVNLPMLLRALTYREEPLDVMVSRALVGATQGVLQVASTAPHNQPRKCHDPKHHDYQQ